MQALFTQYAKINAIIFNKGTKMTEHQEQVAVIQWFRLQYKKYSGYLFAIPNGAHLAGDSRMRAIKMNNMKAEGFTNGVSDLFLMIPTFHHHGLFIEMKAKGGKVSDSQKEFMSNASGMNYATVVCYGFEEAKKEINNYLHDF